MKLDSSQYEPSHFPPPVPVLLPLLDPVVPVLMSPPPPLVLEPPAPVVVDAPPLPPVVPEPVVEDAVLVPSLVAVVSPSLPQAAGSETKERARRPRAGRCFMCKRVGAKGSGCQRVDYSAPPLFLR